MLIAPSAEENEVLEEAVPIFASDRNVAVGYPQAMPATLKEWEKRCQCS